MADKRIHTAIRKAGGSVNKDGSIAFGDDDQFRAAVRHLHELLAEGQRPDQVAKWVERYSNLEPLPDGQAIPNGNAVRQILREELGRALSPCGNCKKPWICEERGCMDKARSEPAPGAQGTSMPHWPILYAILRPALSTGNIAVRQHAERLAEVLEGDQLAAIRELLDRQPTTEEPARVIPSGVPVADGGQG